MLTCPVFPANLGMKKPGTTEEVGEVLPTKKWSRRILNPFLKAPIYLILQGLPSIVHAFVHVCNFQSMQCQKICVGHVRASIELCFKKGFNKTTLGSSITLN